MKPKQKPNTPSPERKAIARKAFEKKKAKRKK